MIINLKTAKMLSITLKASSAARPRGIKQLMNSDYPDVRFWQDSVAKVENRTTQKISRKLIFGLLCGCVPV
jgi:hypothetical protein